MGYISPGERFGDYKLVQPLGEGGFASVYLGEEVHTGTPAAIKLPKAQQVHDFINELRRTVLLQHPNIVKILDFGIRMPDNAAFIIMEYAPNGSFREQYPRGTRVPLNVVVSTVKQVASALQYAHEQRVIHRDVKPENLLLNTRNMVLLSDFGIATASHTAMTANAGQTGQNVIAGTYAYTSPEQLKGHPTPASDQYSLAIMVYEWLCGELPFEGREYLQWRYVHEQVPPPPLHDSIPSLSFDVEQVVLKALAKRPEERFDRVETFALALARAARGEDVSSVFISSTSTNHSTQFDSSPSGRAERVSFQASANSIEPLLQEGVRAQANGNAEEAFRIWRQVLTTQGIAERYSTAARNRMRELRTQLLPLRLKQAREASMQGRWQDEIRLWEDVLTLEPSAQDLSPLLKSLLTLAPNTYFPAVYSPEYTNLQSIQQRLQIAQQNAQAAWMYAGAQQFIHNKDYASARTQLQMLWQDAPYYGDPAGLAPTLDLPTAMNYEQAIAAEQVRLEQEQAERERQEQERLAQLKKEQAIAKQKRSNRITLLIIGTLVLLGAVAGGVAGAGTGTIAGILAGATIAGILAGIAVGRDEGNSGRVAGTGAWIVVGVASASLLLMIVTGLARDITGGLIIGGLVVVGLASVICYGIGHGVTVLLYEAIRTVTDFVKGIFGKP